MSSHSRVIWSQGLFLQPQHFQQQERYVERFVETRCRPLVPHAWGFTEIEFERDLLAIGKVALRRVAGVFPDGTPFQLPDDDPLPAPIDIGTDVRGQILYLAVPLRRPGESEAVRDGSVDDLARHDIRQVPASDSSATASDPAMLEVGSLRTRLLLAEEVTGAYTCVPLAHVIECRADRQVVLDDQFIPTVLHVRAARPLAAFTSELLGLLHQRGEALAGRVSATGRGGAAEFADFLMLQAINRYEPLVAHHADAGDLHPESLFRVCVSAAGEFATFTTPRKRPPKATAYRHDRLRESFDPVILSLRESLSKVIVPVAIAIPIEPRRFGISVAIVTDRSLYGSAVFVLAARADSPMEDLRRRFPAQLRIGPVEKIADLVRLQLPGVPVIPLPVAPPQIPFHAGSAYFELDQTDHLWEQLKTAGGVALHVTGEFPGLAMELWAIRR
ncbi:MAG TPA: type VI secretion system baseplate subunit TssK [Vicinamibacterales bacterium]|nr:type VI secretion system baseplate subunit TssK [Vicinamibacterales bacterium]